MANLEQNDAPMNAGAVSGRKALLIILGAALLVAAFISFGKFSAHHDQQLNVTVLFTNGDALREGAPVRVAGIDVGQVKSIRIRPESGNHPVEVQLQLRTPYELRIPNAARFDLSTAGLLGETFVDVDIRRATGPPLRNGDVLISDFQPSDQLGPLPASGGADHQSGKE